MRYAKVISVMMAVLLMLGLLPGMSTTASAANATTRYNGGDTDYAILNLYVDKGDSAGDATVYGTVNQGGEQLDQDGFVKMQNTPYVAWIVEAPSAGWYTMDPVLSIGNFGAAPHGVYNAVISVNDERYFTGPDIRSQTTGSVSVTSGMSRMDVYLDKGVNVVRLLPLSGPYHYYNRVDLGSGMRNVWVNVQYMGIDSRLTVRRADTLSLDSRVDTESYFFNKFALNTQYDCVSASGTSKAKELGLDVDTLAQENLEHMPYISYTLNAPADGYYDMDVEFSSGGAQHGGDGYLIVRVNGTNYRRWIAGTGFVKTNISVPLKKGDNTVVVTCGLGMKGGTSDQRYEQYHNALSNISWFRNLSVRGGVTLSATQIDPKTVADAPIPSTVLQTEDYGVITGPEVSGSLVSIPSTQEYRDGAWLDKAAVPATSFTVNAPKAGVYTIRAVYTAEGTGADMLTYAITGIANDGESVDKARFEPLVPLSRTQGYSELKLELNSGRNVIRILPVTKDKNLKSFTLDYLKISGDAAVTSIAPQLLQLKAADAEYTNLFTKDEDLLTGNTGSVTTYAAVNGSNLDKLGWFAYTLNAPASGYYDLQVEAAGGEGSIVMVLDGRKREIPVSSAMDPASNPVNISAYLTSGEHTLLITGILGEDTKLGVLTVSGGITKAEVQKDPMTFGVQPAEKEGGLVPGSVYAEADYTLTGIPMNTTGAQFKSNFLDSETAQFLKSDGSVLSDTDIITAGCGVVYPNGSYYKVTQVQTTKSPRSIGADQILAICNPVGRMVKSKNAVHMEMSSASFVLTGTLEGDVSITLDCDEKMDEMHSFYVEVDGELSYFEVPAGRSSLMLAQDLAPGKHTIKVHKGTDPKKEIYYIHSVTYTGTLEEAQPETRRIEFLGDSITAGSGVFFGDCGYGYTQSWFVYANMVADAFGADHYSVANGGWRFTSTYNPATSIYSIYEAVSMHDNTLGAYDFSWKPDVVVINLGTNDSIAYRTDKVNYTQESFAQNIKIQLDQVREKNPDAEIVWIYGAMLTENEAWIKAPVEEYAKTDSKVHYVSVRGNTNGRGDHPDFDGHTKVAGTLAQALSDIMGWEMPTGTHATGDCDPGSCEYCIRNALTLPMHTYTNNCDTTCNFVMDDGRVCEHTRVAPHTFTDCTDTTCENCDATRSAQSSHTYAGVCDPDCDYEGCEFVRTDMAAHSYTDCTDASCNGCGAERVPQSDHSFVGVCDDSCDNDGCDFKRTNAAAHTYTDCTDASCDVCSAQRTAQKDHRYLAACDDSCENEGCPVRRSDVVAHSFDEDCTDAFCNACGAPRTAQTAHAFSGECDSSCNNAGCQCTRIVTTAHSFDDCGDTTCNICDATREPVSHSGGTATCKELAKCKVCGQTYGSLAAHSYNKGKCKTCGAADPDYKPPVTPPTGDKMPLVLLFVLMIASAGAALIMKKKYL